MSRTIGSHREGSARHARNVSVSGNGGGDGMASTWFEGIVCGSAQPITAAWCGDQRLAIGPLELPQQPVAALDRRIQRGLRRFPAAERLLQLIIDHVADQNEGSSRTPREFSVGGFSVISSIEIAAPGLRS